jgi:hypothetical protein
LRFIIRHTSKRGNFWSPGPGLLLSERIFIVDIIHPAIKILLANYPRAFLLCSTLSKEDYVKKVKINSLSQLPT